MPRPSPQVIESAAHQIIEIVRRPKRVPAGLAPKDGTLSKSREGMGGTVELLPNGTPSSSYDSVMGTGTGSLIPGQGPVPR